MRWLKFSLVTAHLCLVAAGASAGPSQPPLVPEGEALGDIEALLAAVSQRSPVYAVAFSPDGKNLASGSDDRIVRLWDVASGTEIRRLEGHASGVLAVAFSPDGKTLASGSDDRTVRLWDVALGTQIRRIHRHSDGVRTVAFSPDGKTLASGSYDDTVRLWDVISGTQSHHLEAHSSWVRAVAFSPDGKTLASGSDDRTVRLWDVASGTQSRRLEGHETGVLAVAFSPDGKTLASGSDDRTVRLWDVGSGTKRRRLEGHDTGVLAVAFSPDGKTLASGSYDGTVRLWDVASATESRRLEGHAAGVGGVAFSPDGKTLASSGSYDGTVRLWSQVQGRSFRPSRILVSGQRGTWLSCRFDGNCLRYDDGTLIVLGGIQPLPPQAVRPPATLTVESVPSTFETTDGNITVFSLKVRNNGPARAFWVNVRRSGPLPVADDPFVFSPPPTKVVLEPGEGTELSCDVSTSSAYADPQERVAALEIEINTARGERIRLDPIEIRIKTPSLEWVEAHWSENRGQLTALVTLRNGGRQDLSETEFYANLLGLDEPLPAVRQQAVAAGEEATIAFAVSEGFEPDESTRITVRAHKLASPAHEWTFADKEVVMLRPPLWPFYVALTLLLLGSALGVGGLRLYRHPLVTRLSAKPQALFNLPPSQLQSARVLLRGTRRLESVLAAAGVQPTWLNRAVAFAADSDPAARCHHLVERLRVEAQEPNPDDSALRTLALGRGFPLNLERCLLYLPPADRPPADVRITLRQRPETRDQVTLIVSADPGHQKELYQLAEDPSNLWVAPSGPQLTGLLLAKDPIEALARLIASQVRLTRISPYQTGGGTDKASMFFGRDQILAHVLNREPANYLVVGGRQMGKSSLLKAIDRHYRDRPDARCHYLVLSGNELAGDLAHAAGLPRATPLDDVVAHLAAEDDRRRLVLIDEADRFIRAERHHDYPTLHHLRSLSETGRCHFILAGFWDLYEAVVLDYQSPVRNFGETLPIGALEADACRQLATRPMATMSLGYQAPELVERIVTATGRRANLISIACNEILKNLGPKVRTIPAGAVDRALASPAIESALGGWKTLAGDDPDGSRLDRILVYATIRRGSFTLADALGTLDELGQDVPPDRVERSLDRLDLAFVLSREAAQYTYPVPLFKKMVLAQGPEVLLQRELASGG